jgi:hypothetical protein
MFKNFLIRYLSQKKYADVCFFQVFMQLIQLLQLLQLLHFLMPEFVSRNFF